MTPGKTYTDIIEEKISEWNDKIHILNKQFEKEPPHIKSHHNAMVNRLRSAIETSVTQLYELNDQENTDNTLTTKDNILKIFESIDRELIISEENPPFML